MDMSEVLAMLQRLAVLLACLAGSAYGKRTVRRASSEALLANAPSSLAQRALSMLVLAGDWNNAFDMPTMPNFNLGQLAKTASETGFLAEGAQDLAVRLSGCGFEDRTMVGTLNVPNLGIGSISWGLRGLGGLEDQFKRRLLRSSGAVNAAEPVVLAAKLKGVNFFDTAERYGNSVSTIVGLGYGETEDLIGRTIRNLGDLGEDVIVATKFTPSPFRTSVDQVVEACEASRKRLGVDVIDLYQIQIPDIVQPWARVPGAPEEWSAPKDEIYWEGMVECYKRGIVANIGVSNYGPTLLRRAYEYFKSRDVPLASNQINYSLLYRKQGAQATVDACKELGIACLAYFPLGMGALTGKWTPSKENIRAGPLGENTRPDFSTKSTLEQRDIEDTAIGAAPLLGALEEIANLRGKSVAQVALNWVICKGAIPIPGARKASQVVDNAGALGWRLTDAEIKRLEDEADKVEVGFDGAGFKRSNSKFVGYGFEEWRLD